MAHHTDERAGISMTGETKRKLTHLVALILPVGILILGSRIMLFMLVLGAIVALFADWYRTRSVSFRTFVAAIFGSMMRRHEVPEIGGPVIINGATWALFSMAILLIVFPVEIAILAYSLAMIGDAAAAIVGRRFGKHTWGHSGRTIEGSLGFVAAAGITAVLIGGGAFIPFSVYTLPVLPLVLGSVVAAAAEIAPLPGNDNIVAPLVTALFMTLVYNTFYDFSFTFFPLFF